MKDVSKPLIDGYFALLDGMVIDGHVVPFCHLKATYPVKAPYILCTGIITSNTNTRDEFDGDATIDLTIYTEFDGDFGNMDLANLIAAEIFNRVIPEPGTTNIEAVGFTVAGAKSRGTRDFEHSLDSKTTFGKRITIEHLIYQL